MLGKTVGGIAVRCGTIAKALLSDDDVLFSEDVGAGSAISEPKVKLELSDIASFERINGFLERVALDSLRHDNLCKLEKLTYG